MKIKNVVLIGFIALGLTACNMSLAADVTPPPGFEAPSPLPQEPAQTSLGAFYPLVAPDPAAGEGIYAEKCAPCHGQNGLGDGERAVDLPNPVTAVGSAEVARLATPVDWYTVVTQGNLERFMPPFSSLTDRQRWDVVAYMYTLSEDAGQAALGEQLYQQNCASCHGESGKGDGLAAANLSMPNFTNQEYMAARSADAFFQAITNGIAPSMPAYQAQLTDSERWALAAYLRSLTFATPNEQAVQAVQNEAPAKETNPSPEQAAADSAEIGETTQKGAIRGMVTNASGGALPIASEVMLHGFDAMQLVISQTTQLSEDASFSFPEVDLAEGLTFFATLQHEGVTYGSEFITLDQPAESLELPITVYDATTELSALKIDRLHLFLEQLDDKTMRVAELFVMSNMGDQTIVAQNQGDPVVTFNLPPGAQDLEFQSGELGGRFVKTADGFGDTASIYPGQSNYQILLAYTLPFQRKLEFSQKMTLSTDAIVVLIPEEGFTLKGNNLVSAGTQDVSGVPFSLYNLDGLEAGEVLSLSVSNRFSLASGSTMNLVIGLSALGIALIGGGIYLFWRNRKNEDVEEDDQGGGAFGADPAEMESPEVLMDAILALDDLRAGGEIPEDAYLQRRAALKARLKEALGEG